MGRPLRPWMGLGAGVAFPEQGVGTLHLLDSW